MYSKIHYEDKFRYFISANANECLDPDTGLNHTIGAAWRLPGICGEAHCEIRGENIYISYAL